MNEEDNIEEYKEPAVILMDGITIQIPTCCSEGREDCKHAVQKQRPAKTNIAV